jgi:Ca2+/Na+ antiporter
VIHTYTYLQNLTLCDIITGYEYGNFDMCHCCTVAVVVSAVYFVLTMIQLSKTAKRLDETIEQLDSDMQSFRNILGYVSGFGGMVSGVGIKLIASFVPKIFSAFFKNKKCKEQNHE